MTFEAPPRTPARRPGPSSTRGARPAIALVLTLIASAPVPAQGRPSTAREITSLIDELAGTPQPTQERAEGIAAILASIEPARSFGPLRDAASIEGKRAATARLVAKTKHPRAWDILGKYVATADYDVVVDALVECGGEVVERELRNRWSAEPVDSTLCSYLASKFARARPNAESVAFFLGKIGDDPKGADAAKIVRAALRLDSSASNPEILAAHAAYQQTAKLYCRAWTTKGLLVSLHGGEAWAENRQYGADTHFHTPLPDWTKSKDHTLVIRFIPLSGDRCQVGYGSTQGLWSVTMQGGRGVVVSGDKVEFPTTARTGNWCEVKFDVKVRDVPGQVEKERVLSITVDGKVLPGEGSLNGNLEGMFLYGASVVGGCELIRE